MTFRPTDFTNKGHSNKIYTRNLKKVPEMHTVTYYRPTHIIYTSIITDTVSPCLEIGFLESRS